MSEREPSLSRRSVPTLPRRRAGILALDVQDQLLSVFCAFVATPDLWCKTLASSELELEVNSLEKQRKPTFVGPVGGGTSRRTTQYFFKHGEVVRVRGVSPPSS